LRLKSMAPEQPVELDLSAALQGGGSMRIEGTLPSSPSASAPVQFRVGLDAVPLQPVAPYLASLLGISASGGKISAQAQLSGRWPERVQAQGHIDMNEVALQGAPRAVTASADIDLTAIDSGARIEVARLKARSGESDVELHGNIDHRTAATQVDLTLL